MRNNFLTFKTDLAFVLLRSCDKCYMWLARLRNCTESCSWDAEADCQKNVVFRYVGLCLQSLHKLMSTGQEKINIPHHSDSHCRYLCNRRISTSLFGTKELHNVKHLNNSFLLNLNNLHSCPVEVILMVQYLYTSAVSECRMCIRDYFLEYFLFIF